MNKEQLKKDIIAAHEAIKEITGKETNLYRPPYGEYNNTVIEAAKECQYHVVQWDVDSLDWKEYGLQALIDKVLNHKNLRPGSIILLHNDSKYTAQALDTIIKGILDKGYKIVPISKLIIQKQDYTIDFEGRQHPINP
jgi:peptidoglycan/xylan/chitin deacetylase (PgdA/CDA1 family)